MTIALLSECGKSKDIVMNASQYGYSSLKCASLALLILVTAVGGSGAQQLSEGIPDNARKKSYGDGWECIRGYNEVKGACAKIVIPKNAFPTGSSYGESGNAGAAIKHPGVAARKLLYRKMDTSTPMAMAGGCNRGYRKTSEDCKPVEVPANAFLVNSAYGSGWECERGFRAVGKVCVVVKLPPNAHLNYSGRDWGM